MNYISEINAFYIWLQCNSLSGNAQALWHRLMAYCNAERWTEEFTVSNARLAVELEVSRQTLDRLRNVLCQKGLIFYKKGSGNNSGIYRMNSLAFRNDDTQNVTQCVTQSGHKADTTCNTKRTQYTTQSGQHNINKNKTKQNKNIFKPPTLEEVVAYCRERQNNVNPKTFYDYFQTSGWIDSKGNEVKNWKQKVITWENHNISGNAVSQNQNQNQISSNPFLNMIEKGEIND